MISIQDDVYRRGDARGCRHSGPAARRRCILNELRHYAAVETGGTSPAVRDLRMLRQHERKLIVKRPILLLTLLLAGLAALPAAAQVNDTYVIPAAINSPGAFGTRWMTQFNVFNPQQYPLTITVVYLPSGGGDLLEEAFDVPPNEARYSDNLLLDLFGIAGSGSLLVATFQDENPTVPDDVISRAFLVTSNTYNNDPGGTYGQTIAGIWTGLQDYQTDGISAIAHGVRNVRNLGWRTNVGAVNLG
ncbi:MAG TPA: hypothetical protein VM779_08420, partial [Thermoanaerobaculia bacterium]|nr:hypothetical protein [Thermoanaerobaculia bacterium]